jgi:hypothetical protein
MIGGEAMLRAIKSYLAFANSWYKLVMLVLVPILLVVVNVFVFPNKTEISITSIFYLYIFDVIFEEFFLRGFYRKHNPILFFMQASPRFCDVINEIVIIDFARRVVVYQMPVFVVLWRSIGDEAAMEWCRTVSFMSWIGVLLAQAFVFLMRHSELGGGIFASLFWGSISFTVIRYVIEENDGVAMGAIYILVMLVLMIGIGTVWYTDKKMKENYYD